MTSIIHTLLQFIGMDFEIKWDNGLRPMMVFINKEFYGVPLTGVEIGVYKGIHAKYILRKMNIKKLYLVDIYKKKEIEKRIGKFCNFVFIENSSLKASKDIPNELDFVYIDSNHNYDGVLLDIETYLPKVRKGGIIGGHDFGNPLEEVTRAIAEYVTKNNIKMFFKDRDWWFIK